MLVSNGIDISPPQSGVIAIANNDVDYDETIQIKMVETITSEQNPVGEYLITIFLLNNRRREIILNQVSNQAGWTDDSAGALQAIEDVNNWIITSTPQFEGFGKITI